MGGNPRGQNKESVMPRHVVAVLLVLGLDVGPGRVPVLNSQGDAVRFYDSWHKADQPKVFLASF